VSEQQNSRDQNDFEFFLGEKVCIGSHEAVVTGQATYAHEPDCYQLLLIDDDGLPFKDWFAGHLIAKQRKH
jgi:hypothetical protein